MRIIKNINRTNLNEIKPRMSSIGKLAIEKLENLIPYIHIKCDDMIISSTMVAGNFNNDGTWENKTFEKSRHFVFMIMPVKKQRYYQNGGEVRVELILSHNNNNVKFKNSITNPEEAIASILKWILTVRESIDSNECKIE
jgi:hypothetical protein